MGWAKVFYYLMMLSASALLFLTGTLMHSIAGVVLVLVAPGIFKAVRLAAFSNAMNDNEQILDRILTSLSESGVHQDKQ